MSKHYETIIEDDILYELHPTFIERGTKFVGDVKVAKFGTVKALMDAETDANILSREKSARTIELQAALRRSVTAKGMSKMDYERIFNALTNTQLEPVFKSANRLRAQHELVKSVYDAELAARTAEVAEMADKEQSAMALAAAQE